MSQQILAKVEASSLKSEVPQFAIGDTVDVHTRNVTSLNWSLWFCAVAAMTVVARSGLPALPSPGQEGRPARSSTSHYA